MVRVLRSSSNLRSFQAKEDTLKWPEVFLTLAVRAFEVAALQGTVLFVRRGSRDGDLDADRLVMRVEISCDIREAFG